MVQDFTQHTNLIPCLFVDLHVPRWNRYGFARSRDAPEGAVVALHQSAAYREVVFVFLFLLLLARRRRRQELLEGRASSIRIVLVPGPVLGLRLGRFRSAQARLAAVTFFRVRSMRAHGSACSRPGHSCGDVRGAGRSHFGPRRGWIPRKMPPPRADTGASPGPTSPRPSVAPAEAPPRLESYGANRAAPPGGETLGGAGRRRCERHASPARSRQAPQPVVRRRPQRSAAGAVGPRRHTRALARPRPPRPAAGRAATGPHPPAVCGPAHERRRASPPPQLSVLPQLLEPMHVLRHAVADDTGDASDVDTRRATPSRPCRDALSERFSVGAVSPGVL